MKARVGKKLRRAQDPKKQHHSGVHHLTQAQSLSQNGKPRKAIKPKYCEFAIFVCLKLWKAQTSQEVAISCLGGLKSSRGKPSETQRVEAEPPTPPAIAEEPAGANKISFISSL